MTTCAESPQWILMQAHRKGPPSGTKRSGFGELSARPVLVWKHSAARADGLRSARSSRLA